MTGKYIRYNNIMVIISLLRILLALFHSMGVFFGLFTYLLSANYRNKTIDNYKLFCISESIKFIKEKFDSSDLSSNISLYRACNPLARLVQISLLMNVDDLIIQT